MKDQEIIILGAGPAGMAAAMELSKKDQTALIVEKENAVGGLAKTLLFREGDLIFRTDIGPHRFFSKNKYLYDFIENLLNEKWILVNRQTRQYIDGKFYDYPIKPLQALKNIGLTKAFLMGVSYLIGAIKFRLFRKKIRSFEDYIVSYFGKKLGEFNMLNYTEKIWGESCKNLHPDWARQRIKGLNLTSLVISAIFKRKKGPKTLVDEFYYPQFGSGLIYETIAEKIVQKGSVVKLNCEPTKIYIEKNRIIQIDLIQNGERQIIKNPRHVISSIPLTHFLNLLSPAPEKTVLEHCKKLKWRSQVYLFLTIDKESITGDNWIYFPNKEVPFGRIAEMKNFSKDMSPQGKTSLFIEFFVTEGDPVWNMEKEKLFDLTMQNLEKMNLLKKSAVRSFYVFKKKYVYPVYDLDYKKNLAPIKKYLDTIENLTYIGRPGRFKYNNQDHSLEMGIVAAKSILVGEKPNLDNIGEKLEYFEHGRSHNQQ